MAGGSAELARALEESLGDDWQARIDDAAEEARRRHAQLSEELSQAVKAQQGEVQQAQRLAAKAEEDVAALSEDCERHLELVAALEEEVTAWRTPLETTLTQLGQLRAAQDYLSVLHELGMLVATFDGLPGSGASAEHLEVLQQMATLADRATADTQAVATQAVAQRSKRLRDVLSEQVHAAVEADDAWPAYASPPSQTDASVGGDTGQVAAFVLLVKLQLAVWRHQPSEAAAAEVASPPPSEDKAAVAAALPPPPNMQELWAMEAATRSLLRRFRYHFGSAGRSTNLLERPEWMFKFVLKEVAERADTGLRLRALCSEGGLDDELCHALSELARPLVDALCEQLRARVAEIEAR